MHTSRWNSLFNSLPVLLLLLLFLLLNAGNATAQMSVENAKKKDQLQQQMKKLQREIAEMEKAIQTTSTQKKLTLQQVEEVKKKIKQKEGQIASFKKEVGALSKDIKKTEVEIDEKAARVDLMKNKYGYVLGQIYSSLIQNTGNVSFLWNNNKSFITSNYLKTISDYRRSQANHLRDNILVLEDKKSDLEASKEETEAQLKAQANLKKELEVTQKEKDKEIALLSEKEKQIRAMIEKKNKASKQLNSSIQRIIEEEIRLAQKKAQQKALEAQKNQNKGNTTPKPVVTNKPETYLTPQEVALSKDFASNQGRLPWPVVKGAIVGYFGKHEHATIKGVFIENNGIDIKTLPGSNAKAVFEGTVVTIFNLPTTQNCIIVKHGEYFSVYSNIVIPIVKVGDKVSTKQSLGSIYTDPSDKATKLHLEIWHGKDKVNPASWLAGTN